MATRLTDRGIAALKPSDDSVYHFDSEVSGLAVRVYPTGRKVFCFDWRENGKQRRVTLGEHPSWTIGKARTHASAPAAQGRHRRDRRARARRPRCRPDRAMARRRRADAAAGHRRRLPSADRRPHRARLRQRRSEGDHPQRASRSGTARSRSKTPIEPTARSAVLSRIPDVARARPQDRAQSVQGRAQAVRKTSGTSFSMPTRSRPPTRRSTGDNDRSAALALRLAC